MSTPLNSRSDALDSATSEDSREDAGGIIDQPLSSARGSSVAPAREWTDVAARALILVVAVAMAWHTWARWGDFQIDCGRELYVPIEILRGKLLYRDLFYPYGPLAPYVGALLVGIFGPHLLVFYLFGIAVAIGCAILLFELGTMLEGRAVGLTAALALLFVGFAPNIFNYIFSYSYGATIGLLLSLLCAFFAIRHIFDRGRHNLLMAGLAASLALLCKQEFGAASYCMLAFVMVEEGISQRSVRTLVHGIFCMRAGGCALGCNLRMVFLDGHTRIYVRRQLDRAAWDNHADFRRSVICRKRPALYPARDGVVGNRRGTEPDAMVPSRESEPRTAQPRTCDHGRNRGGDSARSL